MYEQLKDMMGYASFFYGPTSKEVAFSVSVQSWSTVVNGQWYVGTAVPVDALAGIEVQAPPAVEEVVEGTVVEELPVDPTPAA